MPSSIAHRAALSTSLRRRPAVNLAGPDPRRGGAPGATIAAPKKLIALTDDQLAMVMQAVEPWGASTQRLPAHCVFVALHGLPWHVLRARESKFSCPGPEPSLPMINFPSGILGPLPARYKTLPTVMAGKKFPTVWQVVLNAKCLDVRFGIDLRAFALLRGSVDSQECEHKNAR
jgi:hypothetical protein